MKGILRTLLRLDNLVCTLFIFFSIWLVSLIPMPRVVDAIGDALSDFEIGDYGFSKAFRPNGDHHTIPDTNIVLVNIGHLDRAGIADLLNIINQHEPAAVGIDAFFRSKKNGPHNTPEEMMGDFKLMMALSQTKNLVMVNELDTSVVTDSGFVALNYSHPDFAQYAHTAFANLHIDPEQGGLRTIRESIPFERVKDSIVPSFPAKILELYDSSAYQRLKSRGSYSEVINWRGNYDKFYNLHIPTAFDTTQDVSFVKGKIVLLGFIGATGRFGEQMLEDAFFTPLNERIAGRSFPDMFGVVVHANTISMYMANTYIDRLSEGFDFSMAFILCFLNVAVYIVIANRYKVYYDIITKPLQGLEISILFFIQLWLLGKGDFKMDFTFAIAAVALSGDLTELYIGSLKDLFLTYVGRLFALFK